MSKPLNEIVESTTNMSTIIYGDKSNTKFIKSIDEEAIVLMSFGITGLLEKEFNSIGLLKNVNR